MKKPKKKRLLHAENIPLVDVNGVSRNRRKVFWGDHRKGEPERKPRPPQMPVCACSADEENPRDQRRVLPDAFGQPTDKCSKCRIEAAGVVPVEEIIEAPSP